MIRAAEYGDVKEVRKLLRNGFTMNETNGQGSTPLHIASILGHNDLVRFLIVNGANLAAKNVFENTPLHSASIHGHFDAAKILIQSGADVNARNFYGNTPLDLAGIMCNKSYRSAFVAKMVNVMQSINCFPECLLVARLLCRMRRKK